MLKWIGWKVPATANFHFCTYFSNENNSIFPFFSLFSLSSGKLSPNIFAFTSIQRIACMLMEIVCFPSLPEIGKWKREILDSNSINPFHKAPSKLSHNDEIKHRNSITCKLFNCRFMWAKLRLGLSANPANTSRSS
jgi:hypothetical protein